MTIGSRCLNVAKIGNGPGGITDPVDLPACSNAMQRVGQQRLSRPGRLASSSSPDNSLQIGSPFDQQGYTKQELITQLTQILQLVEPECVRTQDTADNHNVDFPGEERDPIRAVSQAAASPTAPRPPQTPIGISLPTRTPQSTTATMWRERCSLARP